MENEITKKDNECDADFFIRIGVLYEKYRKEYIATFKKLELKVKEFDSCVSIIDEMMGRSKFRQEHIITFSDGSEIQINGKKFNPLILKRCEK